MSLINKYLIKEIFSTLFAVATILFLILISGHLVSLFAKAASGALPVDTILIILGLKSLSNMDIVLPLSFYLAVLLAFSRLYRDNEMTVLAACGIGQFRLLGPVLRLTLLFGLLIGSISLYLSPWAMGKARQVMQKGESSTDIQAFGAGRFREIPGGEGVIYVEETNDNSGKLQNVFIRIQQKGKSQSIISSASGYQLTDEKTGIRFLVLENGYRYDGQPGEGDYVVTHFKKHGIRLTDQELSASRGHKELSTLELWNSWQKYDVAEFQWRISTILLSIILAILALPLSKTSARQGRYTKLGLALLIYIIYTNLLNASRVWLERGDIPYSVGLWWVHIVMLLIALSFYIQPRYFKAKLFKRKR